MKHFVQEADHILQLFVKNSSLNNISLKISHVYCMLIQQKPFKKSKAEGHLKFLEERLKWWIDGEIDPIYKECEAIHQELQKSKTRQSSIKKAFAKLLLEGRLTTAMNLTEQEHSKGLLQLNENVLEELQKLHPPRRQLVTSRMNQRSPEETNPAVFEPIKRSEKYHAAMHTRGSSGPSGQDAANFRQIASPARPNSNKLVKTTQCPKLPEKKSWKSWSGGTRDLHRMHNYCIGQGSLRCCQTDWHRSFTKSHR